MGVTATTLFYVTGRDASGRHLREVMHAGTVGAQAFATLTGYGTARAGTPVGVTLVHEVPEALRPAPCNRAERRARRRGR